MIMIMRTNIWKTHVYLISMSFLFFLCITNSSCNKEEFTSDDTFFEMTGSNTLASVYENNIMIEKYEYENSLIHKAIYYNSGQVSGYRTYDFNQDGVLVKISDYSASNILTSYNIYNYDESLILQSAETYDKSSGAMSLNYKRVPYYDEDKTLIKLYYYTANDDIIRYYSYGYNDYGDFINIDEYDGNDNLISTTNYEYNDSPDVFTKMYHLPWMNIHNTTKQTNDSYVYTYSYQYNEFNFPLKKIFYYNGVVSSTLTYLYN